METLYSLYQTFLRLFNSSRACHFNYQDRYLSVDSIMRINCISKFLIKFLCGTHSTFYFFFFFSVTQQRPTFFDFPHFPYPSFSCTKLFVLHFILPPTKFNRRCGSFCFPVHSHCVKTVTIKQISIVILSDMIEAWSPK